MGYTCNSPQRLGAYHCVISSPTGGLLGIIMNVGQDTTYSSKIEISLFHQRFCRSKFCFLLFGTNMI